MSKITKICANCNSPVILLKTEKSNKYWDENTQRWVKSPWCEKTEEFECGNPNPTENCSPVTVKIVDIN